MISILKPEFPQADAFVSMGQILTNGTPESKGLGIFILTNIASLFSKTFVNFLHPHKQCTKAALSLPHTSNTSSFGGLCWLGFCFVVLFHFVCFFPFYGQLSDKREMPWHWAVTSLRLFCIWSRFQTISLWIYIFVNCVSKSLAHFCWVIFTLPDRE